MNTAGLSTDQAPPLEVPATFYAIIPLAMVTAGALLLAEGGMLLASSWLPRTIALVHVMTLGVLAAAMLGSLYQMVPVVAGSPVPAIRLSHGVAGCLVVGAGALIFGLWSANARAIQLGAIALSIALIVFLVPMAVALTRASGGETLLGMRIAVTCLAVLAALGVRLAWGHAGDMPSSRQALLVAHVDLALVGWVGGLISAVSWQVVPMFYLTEAFPRRRAYAIAIAVGVSALAVTVAALAAASVTWIVVAALPGAIAVLLVEPFTLARMIPRRKRRRSDPTLQFWWSAIARAVGLGRRDGARHAHAHRAVPRVVPPLRGRSGGRAADEAPAPRRSRANAAVGPRRHHGGRPDRDREPRRSARARDRRLHGDHRGAARQRAPRGEAPGARGMTAG
ncbi:MAG: hypothetical protein HYV09_09530 [Deltaproteobacteria bacterium]|nr:hypothetical protein [Deltaproteobacteria bacterium]